MTPGASSSSRVAIAVLALALASCGGSIDAPVAPGLGEACDHETPCADPARTVCLGGACAARTVVAPATATDVVAPITIDVATVAPDSSDPGDVAEDTATDVGADATALARVWLGDHTAVDAPSGDALTLSAGQGAVVELQAPARGRLVAVEVIAREPPGGSSCAVYRPAVWRAEPDGAVAFAPTPSWEGAPIVVLGADTPQEIAIAEGPEVDPGPLRFGLVFEETCPDTARQPILTLDASGDLATTFLWIRGGVGTWVPGAVLQLSGRWALRVGLDVPGGGASRAP